MTDFSATNKYYFHDRLIITALKKAAMIGCVNVPAIEVHENFEILSMEDTTQALRPRTAIRRGLSNR